MTNARNAAGLLLRARTLIRHLHSPVPVPTAEVGVWHDANASAADIDEWSTTTIELLLRVEQDVHALHALPSLPDEARHHVGELVGAFDAAGSEGA